jgi:hypothetical protein
MFRPLIAIFREVLFEGYMTLNLQTTYKYKILSFTYRGMFKQFTNVKF